MLSSIAILVLIACAEGYPISRDDNNILLWKDYYVCGKNFDDHTAWTACREEGYDRVVSWTRKEVKSLDAGSVELPRCAVRTDKLWNCDSDGVPQSGFCGLEHGIIQLECGMDEPNVQEIRAQVCCMSQSECESSAASLAPIFPHAIQARCSEGLPPWGPNTEHRIVLKNQIFGLDGNTWDVTYRITTPNADANASIFADLRAEIWHTQDDDPALSINRRIVNALHEGLIKESHISEERQLSLSDMNFDDGYGSTGQYIWEAPTPPKQFKTWVVWVVLACVGVCAMALMCGYMCWMQSKITAVSGKVNSTV